LARSGTYYRIALVAAALCAATTSCTRNDGGGSASDGPKLPSTGGKKPNVLFILVDTLRADRLGVYGHARGLSPTVDALAREGVTFERCQAASSWTLPSMSSLFTSVYPAVHKVFDYYAAEDARSGRDTSKISVLSNDYETLAEMFQTAGYSTAGFTLNPFMQGAWGFSQGFETYYAPDKEADGKGSEINQKALEFLEARTDKTRPFFLYLHYMDVHGPYDAPADLMDPLMQQVEQDTSKVPMSRLEAGALPRTIYLRLKAPLGSDPSRYNRLAGYREYWLAGYDAGIAEFDRYFAQLKARLQQMNLWDDLLIVFTSDHGEAFGTLRKSSDSRDFAFWEHGGAQHQEQTHVPLIIRLPGVFPADRRVPGLARLIDIKPTLAALLGISNFDPGQGRSMLPMVVGKSSGAALSLSEATKPREYQQEAAIQGNWKIIRTRMGARVLGNGVRQPPGILYELYDLGKDPDERTNLWNNNPAEAKRLLELLDRQFEANTKVKAGIRATTIGVSGEISGALQDLGYAHESKGSSDDHPESQPASRPTDSAPAADSAPASRPAAP